MAKSLIKCILLFSIIALSSCSVKYHCVRCPQIDSIVITKIDTLIFKGDTVEFQIDCNKDTTINDTTKQGVIYFESKKGKAKFNVIFNPVKYKKITVTKTITKPPIIIKEKEVPVIMTIVTIVSLAIALIVSIRSFY